MKLLEILVPPPSSKSYFSFAVILTTHLGLIIHVSINKRETDRNRYINDKVSVHGEGEVIKVGEQNEGEGADNKAMYQRGSPHKNLLRLRMNGIRSNLTRERFLQFISYWKVLSNL